MNKEPLSYEKFRDEKITQQFYTLLLLMICHQVMFQLGIVSRAIIPSTYIFGFVFIFIPLPYSLVTMVKNANCLLSIQ